jgi:hypothetical protein
MKSLLAVLVLVVAADWCVAQKDEKVVVNFDDAKAGATPAGWTVAETKGAGTPATWQVHEVKDDAKHKQALRVDTKNKEAVFNMLLSEKAHPADLTLTVSVKAESGIEDQGGGLVWRVKDADNYYMTRWNPLERNLRVYKVEGGLRTQFKNVEIDVDAKQWHEIKVTQKGAKATVEFDGKQVAEFEDATFKEAGKIGFWTKADASTWFDDLVIETKK